MKKNHINSDTIKHSLRISAKLAAFGFALFIFAGFADAQTNLAKGKTVRQSSTRSTGGAASRAVDGNTNGNFTGNSVTHTNEQNGTWWEVDLGAVYWINSIKVFNRTDCCGDRLKNTRIAVSINPFESNLSGIKYGDIVNQAEISNGQPLIFYGTRQVRYVRIFKTNSGVLSLAEVEVYGKKIDSKTSSSTNIGNSTGTVKNLTGNWAGYGKNGTKSAYLWKISQNGSTLSIKEINTSQNLASKGQINGYQVSATDFGTRGTLSADGNRINWANGESWRNESATSGTSSANNQSSTSTASSNSKLTNGFWKVYTAQGKLVTSYKTIISRSSGKTYINVGKSRREAKIQGNRISISGLNTTGTITDNGNRIAWSDKTIWAIPGYSRLQNSNSNTNSNTSITRNNSNAGTTSTTDSNSSNKSRPNLASGKIARQSSTRSLGGAASRAVDGNTSGVFTDDSVTHTASANEDGTWWEVDLGRVYNITRILIYNRTDCCKERLQNTRIKVSSSPIRSNSDGTMFGDLNNQSVIGSMAFNSDQMGRYVRIYKKDKGVLSLAEVEIYGTLATANSTSTSAGDTNLTVGLWNVYTSKGDRITSYKTTISRAGGRTFVDLGTNRREASIQGNTISIPGMNTTGTITDNGERIAWGNKTVWTRFGYSRLQNSDSDTTNDTNLETTEIVSEDDDDVISGSTDKSKALPASITTYLDSQFKGWEISPESELCGEKNLFQTGDFDGDGKTDYAVYFVVNKNSNNARQILYAFLNKGAYFEPLKISEDKDPENFSFSSFAIIKKGETLQTGEGAEDVLILNVDAIMEYLCETDASATYVYGDGKFSALELYQP